MSNDPGNPSAEGPDEGQNPFKGTPFEQFFGGGAGGLGGLGGLGGMFPQMPGGQGGPSGFPDLSQILGQLQSLMQPYDGPLNWELATDMARRTVAQEEDPSVSARERGAVDDALRLADHWLDEATTFASGVQSTAAWSRAEWVVETTDVWKVLITPVAAQSVAAMGAALPPEAREQAGPFLDLIGKAVGAMLASQAGSGLGALAGEVLSVSDVGLPLTRAGRAALLPRNIEAFSEGLDVPADDVRLYVALREAAHQRLFVHVPWLREHVLGAVTDYARGIEVSAETIQARLEEQMRGLDPSDPESMQRLLDGGLFEMPKSPVQEAALQRLETVLALVEGWVDEVVGQATAERMPTAARLQEAFRRRRAAGGPAERTFATLVGLELRPRRLRDASTLWGSLRSRQGLEGRDGVWMHPDLLPTAADLDDPLGFREDAAAPHELSDAEFDAGLARLLGEAVSDDEAQGQSEPQSEPQTETEDGDEGGPQPGTPQ